MIISVTGTPGVGKTYLAKRFAKSTGCKYLDLNRYIKDNKLYEGYDRKDKTYDVDTYKIRKDVHAYIKAYKEANLNKIKRFIGNRFTLKEFLKKMSGITLSDTIIIDSHLSHYIDCDVCIVVITSHDTLYKRLKKRNYSHKKIIDNLQSEIFMVCLDEAMYMQRKTIIIEN